ncbi:tyrosine-type recombinase/integrase [bacterium]|nr:tyrosine-type recombinase/integrase [bacterium]
MKRGADLLNPQSVKEVIARQETWDAGTKIYVVNSYSCYLKMKGLTWEKPHYKRREKTKFIPLEKEIDALVTGCGKKTATFLQGLKETGCDPTELWRIKWIDIDKANMRVSINHPVKGHNARRLPITEKWVGMLERLRKKSEWVFGKAMYHTYYSNFARQRRRIADRLNNPRILKVTFTSIRHWKATTEYYRTHDIQHVKHMLGHKHLLSTEVYVHLAEELFSDPKDAKFTTRAAANARGCRMLAEAGFEKFDEINGVHLYRRRR